MWIEGSDLQWLRAMSLVAVRGWHNHVDAGVYALDANAVLTKSDVWIEGQLLVEVSHGMYSKKKGQPKELRYVHVYARKEGLFCSIVEPNPARKARNVQLYCQKHMRDGKEDYWQELMHFVYHPAEGKKRARLLQLMYLPDGRKYKKGGGRAE